MMENPNLIRRPILIKGSKVIFGFDKDAVREALICASARRAGTTRRARARGTASSIRRRAAAPKGFDELAFYAEHFDTVEVNSTFYGQPRAEVTRGVGRAHAGRASSSRSSSIRSSRTRGCSRSGSRSAARRRAASRRCSTRSRAERRRPRRVPPRHRSARRSGQARRAARAVSRRASRTRRRRATTSAALLRAFADYPVAVELRHRSWSDAIGETLALLNAFGAAWVQIDEPKFRFSIRQNYLPNVQGFYYMRLHGRNAAQWWTHDKSEDRYNYLYSGDELQEFVETADGGARSS